MLYIVSSEVCLKTALEFPDKCWFTVHTAQGYFKAGMFDFRYF